MCAALIWACLVVVGLLIGISAAVMPTLAILAVLGILVLPWAIRNIHIVILLLAVYTPFEEFVLKWFPGSLAAALRFAPEAVIIVLLIALALRNIGQGIWWKKTPIDLPIALFLVFSALSAIAYQVPPAVWILGIREFGRYILLYYVVVYAELTERTMKFMIGSLLVVAALEAGIGLMQVVLGNRFSMILIPRDVMVGGVLVREGFTQTLGGTGRIFGTLGRYSRYGLYLGSFALLASGLYIGLKGKLTRAQVAGFAIFGSLVGAAIGLSFSRTSWFTLYAGGIVLLLIARWKKLLVLALLIPVVVTVLVLSSVVIEDWETGQAEEVSMTERFASTFSSEYLDVLLRRGRLFIIARVSPIILREYTWLGMGPGTMGSIATGGGTNSPGLMPEYSHEDWLDVSDVGRAASLRFLHDVGWTSILAQVGILGLAAFLWALLELARIAMRCFMGSNDPFLRGLSAGYIGLIAAVVVGNLAVFSLSLRAVSMYVWLLGGLLTTSLIRLDKEKLTTAAELPASGPGGGSRMAARVKGRQLRVLSVNKFHHITGGADRCYFEWSDLLERRGNAVIPFSMSHERNEPTAYARYFVDKVDFFNSTTRDLPAVAMRVLYSTQARRRIEALIEDTRPDVAHLHNVAHQLSPSILHSLRESRIPVIQTVHDYKFGCPTYKFYTAGHVCEDCKGHRYYNAVLHKCNRGSLAASALNCLEMYFHELIGIYDNVDTYIAPSNFIREKMIEYGVSPQRVVRIPNFIAVDQFTPRYAPEDYFLFCGRLLPFKGIITLIAAMESVKESQLYVVGEGELREDLESYVAAHGMKNVRFLGYQSGEDLKSIIANSMFSVIPSEWYENLPYAVLESFALGTPVVAADIGGIPELIGPDVDGVLFEPGNVDDLAEKIQHLVSNRRSLPEMGRRARAKIEQEYDPDTHYERVMSIYRGLLSQREPVSGSCARDAG